MSFDEEELDQHGECRHEIERLRRAFQILKASHLRGTGPYDAHRIVNSALANEPIPPMPNAT